MFCKTVNWKVANGYNLHNNVAENKYNMNKMAR